MQNQHHLNNFRASEFRAAYAHNRMHFKLGKCTLGSILLAASAQGICAIFLGENFDVLLKALQDRFPKSELLDGDSSLDNWMIRVIDFIEKPEGGLGLPLDIRGTVFQQQVWKALQQIPMGKKVSYTEIAQQIGAPKAMRAVAGACAANPLAVVIPCHRVVRADGNLSGYRWGVERKAALLLRENTLSLTTCLN